MPDTFLLSHLTELEDFWGRKLSEDPLRLTYQAFGYPVEVQTNAASILTAAGIASGRYSQVSRTTATDPITMTLVSDPRRPQDAVPTDLPRRLRYLAVGSWLLISGEPWLTAVADLERRKVAAWLSEPLAAAPLPVSRYIFDTTTLNMLIHTGIGQMHASCLYREGRAVLLSAPHNTGKSTTAFRLVREGYKIASDGMTYVRITEEGPELMGYPVGEVKLRMDVLDTFPELRDQGRQLLVRESKKMIYNLREAMPASVLTHSIRPEEIVLCLLRRHDRSETVSRQIDAQTALEGLWPDAAHYDDLNVLGQNLDALRRLLAVSRCYELTIGSDVDDLRHAVNGL